MYQRNSTIEGDDFNRGYGQLLAEQIEGADILILNKTDLGESGQLKTLKELFATRIRGQSSMSRNMVKSIYGKY